MTLEAKLRSQASAFAGLTALLGSSPFRWWDTRLQQGQAYPQVTVLLVSNPQVYCNAGRLPTSFARVQFTIWDVDPEDARAVEQQLLLFLDTFNATGVAQPVSSPNFVVGLRQGTFPDSEPPIFQRLIDVMIFENQNA